MKMNTLEVVKKAYAAWDKKDIEALRPILHKEYKAVMPGGMEINGFEAAKQCLEQCPFEGRVENETYITEGDKAVRIWDFVVTAPAEFRMHMAELSVVKDDKVIFNEAFFDPTVYPKEIQDLFASVNEKMKKQPAMSGKSTQ
jgi:ketosteroid isomerase-like protein